MKLSKEELKILDSIQEGMSDLNQINIYPGIPVGKIKKIFEKLEKQELVTITKKFDNYYKEDYWDTKITEKAKPILESL